MLRKISEVLTGGPRVPVPRCEFVDVAGKQCDEKAKFSCVACGIKLCEIDVYVDPLASSVERRDNRYCFDCYYKQEEKLRRLAAARLSKIHKSS